MEKKERNERKETEREEREERIERERERRRKQTLIPVSVVYAPFSVSVICKYITRVNKSIESKNGSCERKLLL